MLLRFSVLSGLMLLMGCGDDSPCGVTWSGEDPALGTLVLDDGTVLSAGTWASTRLNAGTLTIDVRAMGDETTLEEALAGELPVCRTLDDQNDAVIFQDNGPWISDASHTGTLAISAYDGTNVTGRFKVEVKSTRGETRTLHGAFHLPPRAP